MPPQNRSLSILPSLFLAGLCLAVLSSCGYRQLGSVPEHKPFDRLYLAADANLLQESISQRLIDSDIELDSQPYGTVTLALRDEFIGQAIAAVDLAGDVIEYRRYHHVTMTVIAADGSVLLPEQRLISERRYRFDETRLLASQAEAKRIARALADELTERIMLRLYAIDKPPLLDSES